MAKIIVTTFGALLGLFGLGGFVSPSFLGALCSPAHNLLHLAVGAALVYVAQRTGPAVLFWCSGGAGGAYALLGLAGVIWGRPGAPSFPGLPPDDRLLVCLPGLLELGRADHMLNLFFGLALAMAAVVSMSETPFRLRK